MLTSSISFLYTPFFILKDVLSSILNSWYLVGLMFVQDYHKTFTPQEEQTFFEYNTLSEYDEEDYTSRFLAQKPSRINRNDNKHITFSGVLETLLIAASFALFILIVFETHRFYKQIYLKRYQQKFITTNRVPPYPSDSLFGWFFAIRKVSEAELLRMVGLDAYMLLRFIVVCYKFSLFLTFWGLLVLVPCYGTANPDPNWDRFAISNLLTGEKKFKYRLWVSAFFSYLFTAYFCQLMYAEYNNFSIRRLQYLVQSPLSNSATHNNGDLGLDPDTPPQKYFTVMVERIPGHLRSATALYKYFDKIFPDDVYTVEIALDIKELDDMNAKRKRIRHKLEKAIAYYEAVNERKVIYAYTGDNGCEDLEDGIFVDTLSEFLNKLFSPRRLGYNKVDCLHYYSHKLSKFNDEVKRLQKKYNEQAEKSDENLQRKFKNRHDTRVAAMFENLKSQGSKTIDQLAKVNIIDTQKKEEEQEESFLEDDYIDGENDEERSMIRVKKREDPNKETNPLSLFSKLKIENLIFGDRSSDYHDVYEQEMERIENEIDVNSLSAAEKSDANEILLQDSTIRQWVKESNVDFAKEEQEVQRKRAASISNPPPPLNEKYWNDTDILYGNVTNRIPNPINLISQAAATASNILNSSDHGSNNSKFGLDALKQIARINVPKDEATSLLPTHIEENESESTPESPYRPVNFQPFNPFKQKEPESSTSNNNELDQSTNSRSNLFLEENLSTLSSSITSPKVELNISSAPTLASVPVVIPVSTPLPVSSSDTSFPQIKSESYPPNTSLTGIFPSASSHGSNHYDLELINEVNAKAQALEEKERKKQEKKNLLKKLKKEKKIKELKKKNILQEDDSNDNIRTEGITSTGGFSTVFTSNIQVLSNEQLSEITKLSIEKAKLAGKQGWLQTKLAGNGALRGMIEIERMVEMVMLGAYYKYSSTAFVTFKSRVTESIAQQMVLSHDSMEINHAPAPKDIIWDNVAIPKSQVVMRTYITNLGVFVGVIFWSSLVNSVNLFAKYFPLPSRQQQMMSAVIMLLLLVCVPYVFAWISVNYEGIKLKSEIQNSVMTRYFYYQLVNVYVNVGFSSSSLWLQILDVLKKPQTLVDIIGGRVPDVSLFFLSIIIVKIFTSLPLEMIRPIQLLTISSIGNCMDRRKTTRRELRTGVFFSHPINYGWVFPQQMMVLMIMAVYSCITPLIMPFCSVFFAGAYTMYKYQLLYVYINENQSGGYMWYAVFSRSMIVLQFASCVLIGYLGLQLKDPSLSGPFFFVLPLPICLMYFTRFCNQKFKSASMGLSYGFARELDQRNLERMANGLSVPHDTFTKTLYRQPSLTEDAIYPEPYRKDGTYDILKCKATGEAVVMSDWTNHRTNRRGSISINMNELADENEEDQIVLEEYFREFVLPLANEIENQNYYSDEESQTPVITRERR